MDKKFPGTLVLITLLGILPPAGIKTADADRGGRGGAPSKHDVRRDSYRPPDSRRQSREPRYIRREQPSRQIRKDRATPPPATRKEPKTYRKEIRRDVRVRTRPRVYHRPGYRVRTLPRNYKRIIVRDRPYYYYSGVFYVPTKTGYVVVTAPIGARVYYLPSGYISFYIGPRLYFYANLTYFLWWPETRAYVVVEKPAGADAVIAEAITTDLVIYPKRGQSDAQRDKDRAECHRWAVKESGYDPSLPEDKTGSKDKYVRAMTACLEARGYTVK